jgi:hypothetical protein
MARTFGAYARPLERRNAPGDADRADTLGAEALAIAEAIGMRGLCAQLQSSPPTNGEADAGTESVFRRDGDYWTLAYAGRTIRLRTSAVSSTWQRLVREPGRDSTIDLVLVEDGAREVRRARRVSGGARSRPGRRPLDRAAAGPIAGGSRTSTTRRRRSAAATRCGRRPPRRAHGASTRAGGAGADASRDLARRAHGRPSPRASKWRSRASPRRIRRWESTSRRRYDADTCAYVPDPRHPIVWEG